MGSINACGKGSFAVPHEGILGRPCSSILTSLRLVLFLYPREIVVSLRLNNTKFVSSKRHWLFKRRALTSLYATKICFHLQDLKICCMGVNHW